MYCSNLVFILTILFSTIGSFIEVFIFTNEQKKKTIIKTFYARLVLKKYNPCIIHDFLHFSYKNNVLKLMVTWIRTDLMRSGQIIHLKVDFRKTTQDFFFCFVYLFVWNLLWKKCIFFNYYHLTYIVFVKEGCTMLCHIIYIFNCLACFRSSHFKLNILWIIRESYFKNFKQCSKVA